MQSMNDMAAVLTAGWTFTLTSFGLCACFDTSDRTS